MSNRGITTVVDATGASKSVVLAAGEMVVNPVTGQHIIGDGVTLGGKAQVAQYPPNAYSPLAAGYADALREWDSYAWDATNSHIRHVSTDQNYGVLDDSLTTFSMWMTDSAFYVYYEAWRYFTSSTVNDTVNAAWVLSRMQAQWTHVKASYSAQALRTGDNSSGGGKWVSYTIDDSLYHCRLLHAIADIYGATSTEGQLAIGYLVEFIPRTLAFYADTRSSNPLIDYGVSTPLGVAFKSNTYGSLYPHPGDAGSLAFYGDTSSPIEAGIADEAFWLSKRVGSGSSAPTTTMAAALQQFAINTWTWCFNKGRTPLVAGDVRTVTGLYAGNIIIDPANPDFLKAQHKDYGTPIRAVTSLWEAATQCMASLSGSLATLTGADPKYAAEALAIIAAYPATNGFGRVRDGVPLLATLQDPHSIGMGLPRMMRNVSTLPGFNRQCQMVQAIIFTGRKLLNGRIRGKMSPNWGGEERNFVHDTWNWEDELAGGGGGVQASREQIMVNSDAFGAVHAALMFKDVEVAIGSGVTGATAIEHVPSLVAAGRSSNQESMSRSGGNFTGPISFNGGGLRIGYQISYTFDGSGNYVPNTSDPAGLQPTAYFSPGTFFRVNLTNARFEWFSSGGIQAFLGTGGGGGFSTIGPLYWGGQTVSRLDVNGNASRFVGDSTAVIQYDKVQGWWQVYQAGLERVRTNTLGTDIFGNFSANFIFPNSDNAYSVGGSSARFTTIFLVNSPSVTSDLRDKKLRTANDGALTDAEMDWGLEVAGSAKLFQWLTKAVADDSPSARFHASPIAQDVIRAGQRHGCIPGSVNDPLPTSFTYGFLAWNENPPTEQQQPGTTEVNEDEDTIFIPGETVTVEHRDRYMIRPDGLMWLCLCALDRERQREVIARQSLEARVARLEAA